MRGAFFQPPAFCMLALSAMSLGCQSRLLIDPPNQGPKAAGDVCRSAEDCDSTLCKNHRCLPPRAAFEACSNDAECESKSCGEGVCLAPREPGNSCVRHENCQSALCIDGACAQPLAVGARCAADANCRFERCVDSTCAPAGFGTTCSAASDCESGMCLPFGSQNICTQGCATRCERAGFGCFNGICTPTDFCDEKTATGPGCKPTLCTLCDDAADCLEVDGSTVCRCKDGFFGDGYQCSPDTNGCDPNPCENGGICEDTIGSFRCDCSQTRDHEGDTCSDIIDDCLDAPCSHGGTCIDGPRAASCDCSTAQGYTGARCDEDIDECAGTNPCKNGGICHNAPGGFICDCYAAKGFAGPTCSDLAPCREDLDCAVEQFCDRGLCAPDVCSRGTQHCEGQNVTMCADNGGAQTTRFACPAWAGFTSTCAQIASTAHCSCSADWDCPPNMACDQGACQGTGQAPSCTLPALEFTAPFDPHSDNNPALEFQWGGTKANIMARDSTGAPSPFGRSSQVVMAPLVANLTDDNDDGIINERDYPDIIFATFCDSSFMDNGILRAIHGGGPKKGRDIFASLGKSITWHEGDALPRDYNCGTADLDPTASYAVGNLDNDAAGRLEIVAITEDNRVRISDNQGNTLAQSPPVELGTNPAVAIANLDAAGLAEIVVGRYVFTVNNASQTWSLGAPKTRTGNEGRNGQGPISCVADVVGAQVGTPPDGIPEIIAGATVYRFTGENLERIWHADVDGFCAIADVLDAYATTSNSLTPPPSQNQALDGLPEVILVSQGRVRIFNGQNGQEIVIDDGGVALDLSLGGELGGAPNIDDFDGDGFPEIGTATAHSYRVLDLQPSTSACPRWTQMLQGDTTVAPDANPPRTPPAQSCSQNIDCGGPPSGFACNSAAKRCVCEHNGWFRATLDASSQVTGSSVFDFNGDGAAEVVYNDECRFRMYDGRNGDVLFSEASESRTRIEYPVVADVDNDGDAEIVFGVSNESGFCKGPLGDAEDPAIEGLYNNGLEVWGDPSDRWVAARRIWNQHSYHVTNVTESGNIPGREPQGWAETNGRRYNTYRSNPRSLGEAPDLVVAALHVSASNGACAQVVDAGIIAVEVQNVGDLRVGGVEVALEGDFGNGFVALLGPDGRPLVLEVDATLDPHSSIFLPGADYDPEWNQHDEMPAHIRAIVDPPHASHFGQARECHEGNNTKTIAVAEAAGFVDLSVAVSNDLRCASLPTLEVTVNNSGVRAAQGGVVVRLFAGDPNLGGQQIGETLFNDPIAPGASATAYATLPGLPACVSLYVYAQVDPHNAIIECNEANNQSSQTIKSGCCSG